MSLRSVASRGFAPLLGTMLFASPAWAPAVASASSAPPVRTPVAVLVHHPVSTSSLAAQAAFDEGLTLLYAFNREAAYAAFSRAAAADPSLAMAWWGMAMASGPNINVPMTPANVKAALAAVAHARALLATATPEERAYVAAVAARYPATLPANRQPDGDAYRRAMLALARAYPADDDAQTLAAESVMDSESYGYDGDVPEGSEREILALLAPVLARDPDAVGANHFWVHALDYEGQAPRALASAQFLAALPAEPAASHLVHMAGHIDLDVGNFPALLRAATISVDDDEAYAASIGEPPSSLDYYAHDLDFYAGAAVMLDDRPAVADALRRLEASHSSRALLVLDREGRYAEALAQPAPRVPWRFNAMIDDYGRAIAYASVGNLAGARLERATLARLSASDPSDAAPFLALVDGRIARAAGDDAAARADFERALALTADWSPEQFAPWFYPAGEWLGDVWLDDGRPADAARAFRAALARTPNDARVEFGLMRALSREDDFTAARALAAPISYEWRGPSSALLSAAI